MRVKVNETRADNFACTIDYLVACKICADFCYEAAFNLYVCADELFISYVNDLTVFQDDARHELHLQGAGRGLPFSPPHRL